MDNRYRVLVAGRDTALLHQLSNTLSPFFDAILAADAAMACERLQHYEPDMGLIDLGANLQGLQLCQALHAQPEGRQLPLIFLADTDDSETARKAYAAGCSLMLRKPVEAARLIRNLELSLGRTGPPRSKKNVMDKAASSLTVATPTPAPPVEPEHPGTIQRTPTPPPFESPDIFLDRSGSMRTFTPHRVESIPDSHVGSLSLQPRLMMVDDDPDTIELIQLALQDHYELLAATDGLQALERILEYQPDLVLLDVMMPKMNGFQLCHSLRRNKECQDLPVIFLSAKSSRKDRDYAFQCGATAYLTKPFDMKKLHETLSEIVARPEFKVRPKLFSYQDIHRRERALLREKEELLQDRERRQRYEQMKNFIKKNV